MTSLGSTLKAALGSPLLPFWLVIALLPFGRSAELGTFLCLLGVIMLFARDPQALRQHPGARLLLWLLAAYVAAALFSAVDAIRPGKSWGTVAGVLRYVPLGLDAGVHRLEHRRASRSRAHLRHLRRGQPEAGPVPGGAVAIRPVDGAASLGAPRPAARRRAGAGTGAAGRLALGLAVLRAGTAGLCLARSPLDMAFFAVGRGGRTGAGAGRWRGKSIRYPPSRNFGACSTMVTLNPYRSSHHASVSPAIPAPEMRM